MPRGRTPDAVQVAGAWACRLQSGRFAANPRSTAPKLTAATCCSPFSAVEIHEAASTVRRKTAAGQILKIRDQRPF